MAHSIQANTISRNTSMDLLRVLAILMIICQHIIGLTFGLDGLQNDSLKLAFYQTIFLEFIHCFCVLGVNLFFLLSGYFGIKQKFGKISSMIARTYCLYFLVNIIYIAFNRISFTNGMEAVKYFLSAPSRYWFILSYIIIYLLAPILNLIADHLHGKKIIYFIFITTFIFCMIGFIENYGRVLGMNKGYSPIWGGIVYLYGRIIRLNGQRLKKKKLFWGITHLFFVLLNFLIVLILTITKNGAWAYKLMCHYNNPLILFGSVSLLITFSHFSIPSKYNSLKVFGCISKHTLGIYILHIIIPFGFLINLSANFYLRLLLFFPNALIVLFICTVIDILYDLTLNRLFHKAFILFEKLISKTFIFFSQIFKIIFTDKDNKIE